FGVVERLGLFLVVGCVLDRHLALELRGDQLHLVVGERLRRGLHLTEVHQDLDQLAHRDAERLREVADADAGLDGDGPGRSRGRRTLLAPRRLLPAARLAAVLTRTRRLVVDDDAAPPVARPAAAARAERSVRSRSSVSHSALQCKDGRVPDRPRRRGVARGQSRAGSAPVRSSRHSDTCRRRGRAPCVPAPAVRRARRSARARAAPPGGRSRRSSGRARYAPASSRSSASTGIPAGTSAGGATRASGETAGSSGSVSAGSTTGGTESGSSIASTSSSGSDGPTDSASGGSSSARASSSGSDSATTDSSSSESCSASSWCAGTPQYFEPGSDAFGQRLPFERIAAQRPE